MPADAETNGWGGYRGVSRTNDNFEPREEYRSGWNGWNRGGGYNMFEEHKKFDRAGNRLDKINWNEEEIIPVQKDFLVEHPNVENRTEDECRMIRLRHGIDITSEFGCSHYAPKPVESLEEAPFPDWAAKVLRNRRWTTPSPIQLQGWTVALAGFDLIGIAPTGSGKTMAYVLPMLVHVMSQPELRPGEGPVGLVMVPTRELSAQVADEVRAFSAETRVNCMSVCGGEDFQNQTERMLDRVDVLVATPGRLKSLLAEKRTNLRRVTFVVLDEADEILAESSHSPAPSFNEQIKQVMSQVRPDRQVLFFSATFSDKIREFAEFVCKERSGYCLSKGTFRIDVGGKKLSACKDVDQVFWLEGCDKRYEKSAVKSTVLIKAIESIRPMLEKDDTKAIIFCNKKEDVPEIASIVKRETRFNTEAFTGDSTQAQRTDQLERFRASNNDLQILVSTDLLSRGHNFVNVLFVINYDMPTRIEAYVHRIGRTGRMGAKGYSLTLLEEVDLRLVDRIVELLVETDVVVPAFLRSRNTSTIINRWRREWANRRWKTESTELEWQGRGNGRLNSFLQELRGEGWARR